MQSLLYYACSWATSARLKYHLCKLHETTHLWTAVFSQQPLNQKEQRYTAAAKAKASKFVWENVADQQ